MKWRRALSLLALWAGIVLCPDVAALAQEPPCTVTNQGHHYVAVVVKGRAVDCEERKQVVVPYLNDEQNGSSEWGCALSYRPTEVALCTVPAGAVYIDDADDVIALVLAEPPPQRCAGVRVRGFRTTRVAGTSLLCPQARRTVSRFFMTCRNRACSIGAFRCRTTQNYRTTGYVSPLLYTAYCASPAAVIDFVYYAPPPPLPAARHCRPPYNTPVAGLTVRGVSCGKGRSLASRGFYCIDPNPQNPCVRTVGGIEFSCRWTRRSASTTSFRCAALGKRVSWRIDYRLLPPNE
jgi:hypothetical protein